MLVVKLKEDVANVRDEIAEVLLNKALIRVISPLPFLSQPVIIRTVLFLVVEA